MHEDIDIFIHTEGGSPKVVRANTGESLEAVLKRAGVHLEPGASVFIGECNEAEHDDSPEGEDKHEPSHCHGTLHELNIKRGHHVHVHKCRRIAVEVHYQAGTKHRKFSPATTIAVTTRWARKAFKLHDADAEKLVLRICGTDAQPRPSEHLGELTTGHTCSLCFNLVPEQKVEG